MHIFVLPRHTRSLLPFLIGLLCIQFAFFAAPLLLTPPFTPPTIGQPVALGTVPHGLTPDAWHTITEQIAAGPYGIYPTMEGRYASANPAHGWQITYTADGRTRLTPRDPDAAPWEWGLRLAGYGFTTFVAPPRAPRALVPADQRMAYQWDGVLDEWWQNGANGLEQGFTVHERPAGGAAGTPLRVLLDGHGNLPSTLLADGFGFHDSARAMVLSYTKLQARDAAGRILPTAMTVETGRITLAVDDTGAHYPLTIDPLVQQDYLKASNTDAGDFFGRAVAIHLRRHDRCSHMASRSAADCHRRVALGTL